MTAVASIDVVVVGAGPAGLAAATALRRHGAGRVVVYERELQPGGIPRHTDHWGYRQREPHGITTGPRYAAQLVRLAEQAGVELEVGRTVQSLHDHQVVTTGASGPATVVAKAVVLATGVRERPRSARLVPGDRPAGVLTTGALQQFTFLHHQQVGRRAVVVGAEHVSFSAVLSLRHAGCAVAAMVTPLPRHQSYWPLALATARRLRVPVLTDVGVISLTGSPRVQEVTLSDGRRIECDTVVFTGDWVPDHELARQAGLPMLAGAKSPVVDAAFRTEQPGMFAAGNLVHPAETADVCWHDGRAVATAVTDWLGGVTWPATVVPLDVAPPLAWASHTAGGITLRVAEPATGRVEVRAGDRLLHRTRRRHWLPNRAIHLPAAPAASAAISVRLAP